MTLGLDASTTTVGFAFTDSGLSVKDAGFIDISDITTNKEKALFVIDLLAKNKFLPEVTTINLEAPLFGFARGRTSQQVIVKLIRFNAVFEYVISEYLNIPINLVNSNTVRKQLFGKCRIKGMDSKEFVKLHLEKIVSSLHDFDKKTSRDNIDKRNGDTYDAIVCSCYHV